MDRTIDYRLSTDGDLAALADLRWRLQGDDLATEDAAYHRFIQDFVRVAQADPRAGELFHWVACEGDRLVGAMSVIIVRKVPRPDQMAGRWGYLTNCYVRPEVRDRGVGGSLLANVKTWAAEMELELLVVWPSDRAYPFYQRAGFARPAAPLVLGVTPAGVGLAT